MIGVKYPNINAKIKGMYAKRITKDELENAIKQKNIKSMLMLLKEKNNIFKDIDEKTDRLEVEYLLEESQVEDIKKIIKLLNKKEKAKFDSFLLQYEIKCIKSIVRIINSNQENNNIIVKRVKKWIYNLFYEIRGIETVSDFNQFFGAIKRMKYHKILKKYQEKDKINVFELENELDKMYFEKVYEIFKNEKNLKKIIGSEIDLLNVLWIYRAKKYFSLEDYKIYDILIKKDYKINENILEELIHSKSFDQIKDIMSKTVYKDIFTNEEELENNVDRYLYKINKDIFKNDIYTSSYIYAYINLIDYENNDIINAIEGIRYNINRKDILRRLIR